VLQVVIGTTKCVVEVSHSVSAFLVVYSCIADCRSELRWSVRDAHLYWRPPFKSPFFDSHQFGGCWGGVSLALLVLNSGELVGGVSFPAPVLLCAAPVLLPLLKP
jgi:hypothetical protein